MDTCWWLSKRGNQATEEHTSKITVQPSGHPTGIVRREHPGRSHSALTKPSWRNSGLRPEGFIGICQELISPE